MEQPPIMLPQHIYDHLIAQGIEPEGVEPVPEHTKGPDMALVKARCAYRTGLR
jgi:hypothetical protein